MNGPLGRAPLSPDTVVAIATAPGAAGVGIVRVSGPECARIAHALFRHRSGRPHTRHFPSHKLIHGYVIDSGSTVIDEVLCVFMRGPRSYTAEDVVEFHAHGGLVALRGIVRCCLEAGARPAEPGEFTLRAFLHGRLDLAQAEAVADVIAARSDLALRVAERQLQGDLSRRLARLREPILELLAHCEAVIDFAEEGVPDLRGVEAAVLLQEATVAAEDLLREAEAGRMVREGVRAAIVGRPNVGKSSLLNALLRLDRAIVTPVPGTTRDTLEETVDVGGVPVTFIDTAGIHTSIDVVERIGIERAWRALTDADLAILVLDRSARLDATDLTMLRSLAPSEDKEPFEPLRSLPDARQLPHHVVVVINKCDLDPAWGLDDLPNMDLIPVVQTCLIEQRHAEAVEEAVRRVVWGSDLNEEHVPTLSNLRHVRLVQQCLSHLRSAQKAVESELALDFLAIDLHAALESLCDITGEAIGEALLDAIFSRFCIGK